MAGFSGKNRLELHVPWRDDDMIELETRLESADWRGWASAYSTVDELRQFADRLLAFLDDTTVAVSIEAGFVETPPHVSISIGEYDLSGHLSCQVQFSNPDVQPARKSSPFQMSGALITEPIAVDRFARELISLLREGHGVATLLGE